MYSLWHPANILPDDSRLRAGATALRGFADSLASRAAIVRDDADQIGPTVWTGNAAETVRQLLTSLADEQTSAVGALRQAADALDSAAHTIAVHRPRYEELSQELKALDQGQPSLASTFGTHAAAQAHLAGQQAAIERDIEGAMANAAAVVRRAAAAAPRAQHGPSAWSRLTDFARGFGSQIAGLATSVWNVLRLMGELDPDRALYDPQGYRHSLDQVSQAVHSGVNNAVAHPGDIVAALLDGKDWQTNKARWAGAMFFNVLTLFGGEAADLGTAAEALQGTAKTTDAAAELGAADAAGSRIAAQTSQAAGTLGAAAVAGTHATQIAELNGLARWLTYTKVIGELDGQMPHPASLPIGNKTHLMGPDASFRMSEEALMHITTGGVRFKDPEGTTGGFTYWTGGHLAGVPGEKPQFPLGWTEPHIVSATYGLIDSPSTTWAYQPVKVPSATGDQVIPRYVGTGTVDGLSMRVVVAPYDGGIVSAFPYTRGYQQPFFPIPSPRP